MEINLKKEKRKLIIKDLQKIKIDIKIIYVPIDIVILREKEMKI